MRERVQTAVTALVATDSKEEFSRRGAELLDALFESPAAIYAFDSADELVLQSTTASSVTEAERTIPVSSLLLERTAALERSALIDDCADTRSAATTASAADAYRSAVLVPIDDWGVLIVADAAPAAFDDDDHERAELVSGLLAALAPESRRSPGSADEKLERIGSILSHDLVNPMMVARAYVQRTMESGDLENLERVELALDRIDELTSGLERFARTGRTVEEVEPIDLGDAADIAWSMIDTRDASLECVTDDRILADESRLHQLFENLFSNAIVHGGSSVNVRVGKIPDGSGFYVEDDGPGIPRDRREHVFEHGFSGTEDRSGYGLSIVEAIADAHGWSIAVSSADSGGARFEITGVDSADTAEG